MDKTVKDTESIDAIAAYKKQSSDHIKRMSRTAPPAAIQAPERQHLATKGRQHRFSDSRAHALPTWKWWSKHHRPQSLTEGGPQSVGGSVVGSCSRILLSSTPCKPVGMAEEQGLSSSLHDDLKSRYGVDGNRREDSLTCVCPPDSE